MTDFDKLKQIVENGGVPDEVKGCCEKMMEFQKKKNGALVKKHILTQQFGDGNVNQQLVLTGPGNVYTSGFYMKLPNMKTPIEVAKISYVDDKWSAGQIYDFFVIMSQSPPFLHTSRVVLC